MQKIQESVLNFPLVTNRGEIQRRINVVDRRLLFQFFDFFRDISAGIAAIFFRNCAKAPGRRDVHAASPTAAARGHAESDAGKGGRS